MPDGIQINVDAGNALAGLEAIRVAVNRAVDVWLAELARDWPREARRLVPRRTGRLRRSIHAVKQGNTVQVYAAFYMAPLQARQGRHYGVEAFNRLNPIRRLRELIQQAIQSVA